MEYVSLCVKNYSDGITPGKNPVVIITFFGLHSEGKISTNCVATY